MLGSDVGDEVAADVVAEHRDRCSRYGRLGARFWVWRQVVWAVVPALRLRRRRRRGRSGPGSRLSTRTLDLGGAVRELRRHPGMSLAVILTLGLGIAASTGVFAIVSGVLLAPLPYDRPERIGILRVDQPAAPDHPLVTGLEYRMVRDAASIAHAAVVVAGLNLPLETPEGPRPVLAGGVGVDLFRVLGAETLLGRGFLPEDLAGGGAVTVLTWRFWQDELGGDPGVLGRSLTLGGRPYDIVGVLPREFELFVGRDARGADDAALFFPVRVA
ncbi:MAG TPA: ABC transporter permease, partial [Longimicrobiales bacterium]|nr:ABC transporter permease [Longimicrobiales bacterium]